MSGNVPWLIAVVLLVVGSRIVLGRARARQGEQTARPDGSFEVRQSRPVLQFTVVVLVVMGVAGIALAVWNPTAEYFWLGVCLALAAIALGVLWLPGERRRCVTVRDDGFDVVKWGGRRSHTVPAEQVAQVNQIRSVYGGVRVKDRDGKTLFSAYGTDDGFLLLLQTLAQYSPIAR